MADWFDQLYQQYLGRAPGEADRQASSFYAGANADGVKAGIMASPEYAAYQAKLADPAYQQQQAAQQQADAQAANSKQAMGLLSSMLGGRSVTAEQASPYAGLLGQGMSRGQAMANMAETNPDIQARIAKGYEMPWYDPNQYMAQQRSAQPTYTADSIQTMLQKLLQQYMQPQQYNPYGNGWDNGRGDAGPGAANGGPGGSGHGDGGGVSGPSGGAPGSSADGSY